MVARVLVRMQLWLLEIIAVIVLQIRYAVAGIMLWKLDIALFS